MLSLLFLIRLRLCSGLRSSAYAWRELLDFISEYKPPLANLDGLQTATLHESVDSLRSTPANFGSFLLRYELAQVDSHITKQVA